MTDEQQVDENVKPVPGSKKFLGCGCIVWTIVGLFGFFFLVALCLPAVSSCKEAARRIQCRNNLKQIGLGLHRYRMSYGCFPPACTVDELGRPMHSWRAMILPFTDEGEKNCDYDFSQPWNSPDNIAFAEKSPLIKIYACPSEYVDPSVSRTTSYVMLVGPNAFGRGSTSRKIEEITDELDETIIVSEMAHSGIFWTAPWDLDASKMCIHPNDSDQVGLRSDHSGGVHALFADGSVSFINDSMSLEIIEALITINGGEEVEDWQ